MTFVKGTTLWHVVRSIGHEITTVCGRHLSADMPTAENLRDQTFICRACASSMRRAA
jgi:hypothetical protein